MKRLAIVFAVSLTLMGCGDGGLGRTQTYTVRSPDMEPTLHCAKPVAGCRGTGADRIVVQVGRRGWGNPGRGDILAFYAPPGARAACGGRHIFVQRLIGQSDDTVHEDDHGFVWIDGQRLNEPYVRPAARLADSEHFGKTWKAGNGWFFFTMGDNRAKSCDSRVWGSVPQRTVIGRVVKILRNGKTLTPTAAPYPQTHSRYLG